MLRKIKCLFGKHKYFVIENYSTATRKLGCRNCDKQWGMNDRVRALIPWDTELDELHKHIRDLPDYN